jgi:hypothetical protein
MPLTAEQWIEKSRKSAPQILDRMKTNSPTDHGLAGPPY